MNPITNNPEKSRLALEALRQILDPEIGLNVVDLGLIYRLDFDEVNKELFCTMTLTTSFCPMGESITFGVMQVLEACFPGYPVHVDLTFDPLWSQDMISAEGLQYLNR